MKKTNYFYYVFVLVAFSFFNLKGQNFVRVDQSQSGQAISLSSDEVLEIQLPVTPSNGFAWYL